MRSVYIWGIGAFYHRHRKELKKYCIDGYIDNRVAIQKKIFNGKRLISSNEITSDMNIIIMSMNYVTMAYELIKRGIKKFAIGMYLFPEDYQSELLARNGKFIVEDDKFYYKGLSGKKVIEDQKDISDIYSELIRTGDFLEHFKGLPEEPFCRNFGISRGTPIDRIYIENFLEKYKMDVHGDALEIAENTYTLKYGDNRVKKSYVLHVKGWGEGVICGNLESGEGIEKEKFDVAIITQTLMFIYQLEDVVKNIYYMLKPGGVALVTVAGISQVSRYDEENWGSYWNFQKDSLERIFEKYFQKNSIIIESYGNVKTAMALLYGICTEELDENIYKYNDLQYPVILGIRAEKEKE